MTDTETHQSDPGLTFGAVYLIYVDEYVHLPGTFRLERINDGRLVFSRLSDSEIVTHLPTVRGLRFVEVQP